jgi:hypothetical protein
MSEEARKSEAKGESTVDVEFRGDTFTISREYDEWPVDFLDAIEEGKTIGIVKGALGPAQWRRVRSMNLKIRELAPLGDSIVKALGFADQGESGASSD